MTPDHGHPTATEHLPIALLDGTFVPHEKLLIHRDSQAMRYAVAVFEGVRGYRQMTDGSVRLFRLESHLDRLQRSMEEIRLPTLDTERDELVTQLAELVTRNEVRSDCYLRIVVASSVTENIRGAANASWSASLKLMGRCPWLKRDEGMAVTISRWRKPSSDVFPQHAKCISNYSGPRLAYLEARRAGFDSAVLTNERNHLTEAPTANLFLVENGALSTPPLEDGILPGITRETVIRLATELSLDVRQRSLTTEDARAADEAFLCGTGLEFGPIETFNDRRLTNSRVVTSGIIDLYFRRARALDRRGGE